MCVVVVFEYGNVFVDGYDYGVINVDGSVDYFGNFFMLLYINFF